MTQEQLAGIHGHNEELLALAYQELRQLAACYMRRERADHTLQPTALVHEAYLRLAERRAPFHNRLHFLSAAARAMRRVLTDHARARESAKRGGGWLRAEVSVGDLAEGDRLAAVDILALDEALGQLDRADPLATRIVELRFFGGLSNEEVAEALGCCVSTVEKRWRSSRAWLHTALAAGAGDA